MDELQMEAGRISETGWASPNAELWGPHNRVYHSKLFYP